MGLLKKIPPILTPDLLHVLRSMGHGDKFVLSDANFPSYSQGNKLYRMDGLNVPQAAEALLSHFRLDSFVSHPVQRMEIDGKPCMVTLQVSDTSSHIVPLLFTTQ